MEYTKQSGEIDSAKLLAMLKQRLRIFHNDEDEMLKDILDGSVELITQFTGVTDLSNATFRNLVLTRGMYVFNDQAEYFFENYRAEINDLALEAGGVVEFEQTTTDTQSTLPG